MTNPKIEEITVDVLGVPTEYVIIRHNENEYTSIAKSEWLEKQAAQQAAQGTLGTKSALDEADPK